MTKRRPLALGAAAVLGLGSLFIAAPAMAEDTSAQDPTQQQAAVAPFGAEQAQALALEAAAAQTGEAPEVLAQQRDAGEILIAQGGHIAIVDPAIPAGAAEFHTHADSNHAAAIPGDPVGGSRPGAPVTIYLDFDGETVEGTAWNDPSANEQAEPVFNMDPATGLDQNAIWERIAEDYAPFNVNVTLTNPGADALYKSSADDATYGSHLVFTDSYPEFGEGSGGIAFVGGTGSEYLSPAFVFTQGVGGNTESAADAGAHEVGHNFGLSHDGFGSAEYYQPEGGIWGPIMGAPYNSPLTQWSNGDYAQATNQEDDLALITDRSKASQVYLGFQNDAGDVFSGTQACIPTGVDPANPKPGDIIYPLGPNGDCNPAGTEAFTATFEFTDRADYAADDHGDDAASATTLNNADNSFSDEGVIGSTGDVDVFKLTTGGGQIAARVDVAEVGANLNSKLTLTDSSGDVVAEDNQTVALQGNSVTGLSSEVSADVNAGIYYLAVTGVGQGDPGSATIEAANGFSSYGSLGNYTISGQAPVFDADPVVIISPEDGSAIEAGGATVEVVGTAEAGADVTVTANGELYAATANDSGAWNVDVTAAVAGETKIEASEVVDGIAVEGTDAVTVVAPVAEPVVTSPKEGDTTSETPTFTGTGIAGAEVSVDVVEAGEEAQPAARAAAAAAPAVTTVDENGNWSVTIAALADGSYSASAVQTINNVTSDPTAPITFTAQAAVVTADADANGTAGAGADGSAGAGADGSASAGAGANGTAGAGGSGVGVNGSGSADGSLANTGADFDFAPMIGLITLALLVSGGVLAAVAIRQRKLHVES